ncbi:MAG: YjgN family protein [Clostridia bacterium]|nr:YjgN family protein [Clostridia bacterium]
MSQPQVNVYVQPGTGTGAGTKSYFDGGLGSYIGVAILGAIITVLTLGICYPWAVCRMYRWKVEHTVIEGRRLRFDGTATGLFGHWIKWLLLSIITIGIYLFWVHISLEKWKAKHTFFAS